MSNNGTPNGHALQGGNGGPAYIAESLRPLAVPIASLNLDAANARRHPEKNLDAIKASLARWGQRAPLVVQREGMIVRAGNGRLIAAKALGWAHVACLIVDESSVEATAFAIADNRTAELAEWDEETLATLLQSLPDASLTGFDEKDLKELLAGLTPDVAEDEAPEPLPDPVSRAGDLWELGPHRLLCGDSTKAEDAGRVCAGESVALCLSDPPYGVGLDYASWDDTQENLVGLISGFLPLARERCRGSWGFVSWQPILAYGKDPFLAQGKGARPDAFDCNAASPTEAHPCPKPIPLWVWLIERGGADHGDAVYDPFLGSGTTLVACEQLGRRCYAIEIEPRYVDVAIRRWQNLTGKEATLDGKTWAQVAEERGVCTTTATP